MTRAGRLALVLVLGAACLRAGPAGAIAVRPVEYPAAELAVTVAPAPLGIARPALQPPAPPPALPPPIELGEAPLPRFATTVTKPLPTVRDAPGGFSCTFVAFRRAETLAKCGIHRMLLGDVRGAREAFEESVAIDPRGEQAPAAYVWLGEVAVLEARYDQAERRYRTALAAGPPPDLAVHAALGLGLGALRRGDVPEAQRALAQAATYVPPQPVALVVRFLDGVARLLAGQAAAALAQLDGVAASGAVSPMSEEVLFWRGAALARLGDREQAVRELDRFVAAVPTTHPLRADAVVQIGWIAIERGAPDEAARRFVLADAANPRPELRPLIRAGLARAYLALGDAGRAGDQARRLAIESPRDPLAGAALLSIAEAAGRRGSAGEALDGYRQLLALPVPAPVLDYASYRLGEGLEQQGRPGEAREYYRRLRDGGRDEAIAQRAAYRLGLLALRDNDPAGAGREGEALLRAGTLPELREAVLLLTAEGAARANDPNRAGVLFRLALRDHPGSPRTGATRLGLGWALLRDGEPEMALREWQDLAPGADLVPGTQARLAIVDVALRQGHEALALDTLRQLRSLAPGDPLADAVTLAFGLLSVRARAYQDAVQALEPLAPRAPDYGRQALVRRALGIARYHLGQTDLAERQFRLAAHAAPAEPSSWLGAGLAALAQGRLAEADDALLRARVGAVPEVAAAAAHGLVLVAVRRGDPEAFRDRATTFVDRYPGHPATPPFLYGLAVAALDQGALEPADGWVRRLVRDQPKSDYVDDALLRLAAAADKRPALARQAYRDLLARRPPAERRAEAWLGVAEAALALGDAPDAQRGVEGFLRDAPSTDPRGPRAYALLVRAHQGQGQRAEALAAAEAFLRQFPADPFAPAMHLTRGQFLLEARRWDLAQQAFEAARSAGEAPVAAPAQFWLGEALRARDQHGAAIAAYLGATYLYPDTPWAPRGLQGAAQSYLALGQRQEAAILLRKLAAAPGAEPASAQWARQTLTQLGPLTGTDPAEALRRGAGPRP